MTVNRSALNRKTAAKLLEKVQEATNKKTTYNEDPNMWKPTYDDAGNAYAVLRFLPAKTEDSLPYVKVYTHAWKENGSFLFVNCPTSIGKECPICNGNSELWKTELEANKKIASRRKRTLKYISNVLVIKDPKNSDNDGKIFKYSYGKTIHEKLVSALKPPVEFGDEPRDPFSFFDGCTIKLNIYSEKKGETAYPNYTNTTVHSAGDLYDGDEDRLMEVLEGLFDLDSYIAEGEYEEFDAIDNKFTAFLAKGTNGASQSTAPQEPVAPTEPAKAPTEPAKAPTEPAKQEPAKQEPAKQEPANAPQSSTADGDDDMDYFNSLAN